MDINDIASLWNVLLPHDSVKHISGDFTTIFMLG
jgi:hypothetical protein